MSLLNKFVFLLKRPKVIMVSGKGRAAAKEAIFHAVSRYFKVGKEVLIIEDSKDAEFFLNNSPLPILVATHAGEYHPEKEFFAGEEKDAKEIAKLAGFLPSRAHLILNFDDETVRDIKNRSKAHPLTFGFGARSDIRSTDIVLTQFPDMGTNFKINYDGNIVPCWLENLFGKENIYAALAAVAVGEVLELNLVQILEAFKGYKGLAGRMRLIKGIKNTMILDDSESASPLSMMESLIILKGIGGVGRKIAVLGDIVGAGKYAVEAHETIGQSAKASADLLVTVGERAKFFAEGAAAGGMEAGNIFRFDDAASAGKLLQEKMKEGDLILIDGSKEMSMIDIVREIEMPSSSSPV